MLPKCSLGWLKTFWVSQGLFNESVFAINIKFCHLASLGRISFVDDSVGINTTGWKFYYHKRRLMGHLYWYSPYVNNILWFWTDKFVKYKELCSLLRTRYSSLRRRLFKTFPCICSCDVKSLDILFVILRLQFSNFKIAKLSTHESNVRAKFTNAY